MNESTAAKAGLTVRVLAPTSKLYEGSAVSVSAANKVGSFDILVGHANFFSLLSESQVKIDTGTQQLLFPIHEGLVKVKNNSVTLFIGIQTQPV